MQTPNLIDKKLYSTYDRLQEAHWNIHQMELHYHDADVFRFSLNSFLRVLKEIPQILQMELQNEPGFNSWYKNERFVVTNDPLIADLFKKRDIVVHKKMLKPKSSAYFGITEGRGMKLGMGMPLDPLEDSDVLMIRYLMITASDERDFLGVLMDDEDSLPCIQRIWKLEPYEDDVIFLCARAWDRACQLFTDSIVWLGGEPMPNKLDCIHSDSKVSMRLYNREWLRKIVQEIPHKNFGELLEMLQKFRRGTR